METYIKPPRTGIEAFELMPEGTLCQLINDVLVMSPAPNIPHANVLNEIFFELLNYVKKRNMGKVYCAPVDVFLNEKNIYQPDIIFISSSNKEIIKKRGIYGAPDIIFEILSEDRNYDLKKKKQIYEQCNVKEYWVVDPETKWAEGFVLENKQFKSVGESVGNLTIRMLNLNITY